MRDLDSTQTMATVKPMLPGSEKKMTSPQKDLSRPGSASFLPGGQNLKGLANASHKHPRRKPPMTAAVSLMTWRPEDMGAYHEKKMLEKSQSAMTLDLGSPKAGVHPNRYPWEIRQQKGARYFAPAHSPTNWKRRTPQAAFPDLIAGSVSCPSLGIGKGGLVGTNPTGKNIKAKRHDSQAGIERQKGSPAGKARAGTPSGSTCTGSGSSTSSCSIEFPEKIKQTRQVATTGPLKTSLKDLSAGVEQMALNPSIPFSGFPSLTYLRGH